MSVQTYSLRKNGDDILSRNFLVAEFACHDGSDPILIDDELVRVLQAIRDHFANPLLITSGYRSAPWNRHVGGVPDSQHLLGKAADINVSGQSPAQLYQAVNSGSVRDVDPNKIGLGIYKNFVHVDVRGHKARWSGRGVTLPG